MPSWAIEGVVNYLTLHDYQNDNFYWYSKTIRQGADIFCISIVLTLLTPSFSMTSLNEMNFTCFKNLTKCGKLAISGEHAFTLKISCMSYQQGVCISC